jgi:site-specific DNA-methyltransferase (adenine-specific)
MVRSVIITESIFENIDCMVGMQRYPDKFFDLAIVDPPYFKGPNTRMYYGQKVNKLNIQRKDYPVITGWDVPGEDYFKELFRVSKNQIIWGCNYFNYPFGPGRIVWDKVNGVSSFSDAEIAYCSIHDSVRLFRYMWNGMLQGKSITEGDVMQGDKKKNEVRIHPTQKPVILYEWQLQKYAQPGWKILDTHVGSASSLISCHKFGFDYTGYELDKGIYKLAYDRLEAYKAQLSIFDIGIKRLNG